jgi:NAD(P)-dependent dehydrogenase (short-subunit alcohol dehydrogenase family)
MGKTFRREHASGRIFFATELDPTNEEQVADFFHSLDSQNGPKKNWDLIINCIGQLDGDFGGPEKSLNQINPLKLQQDFLVNACVTPLWLKYLRRQFPRDGLSAFITLSARVGSIHDNQLGGWYGYRASKAALNMLIKTASIELKRSKIPCMLIAYHPGTTRTKLSENYLNNTPYTVHSPLECANNLLNQLENWQLEDSGHFYDWKGELIPW